MKELFTIPKTKKYLLKTTSSPLNLDQILAYAKVIFGKFLASLLNISSCRKKALLIWVNVSIFVTKRHIFSPKG